MTFEEWTATRKWTADLAKDADWPVEVSGFFYQPVGVIEATEGGASPAVYNVPIYNTEQQFKTLEDAEFYLWEEFAKDEGNAT